MGLIVDIYKNHGQDWSNGGCSSRVDEVTLVNVDGPFDPKPERPAAMLVRGALDSVIVVPAEGPAPDGGYVPLAYSDRVGPMAGGCYVATSDSRFGEAVEKLLGHRFYGAVPLHDRWETTEQYQRMSA